MDPTVTAGLIGGGSAVVASAIAAGLTYFATSRSIRAADKVAREQRLHEASLAQDDRRQSRLERADLEVSAYITSRTGAALKLTNWARTEDQPAAPVESLFPQGEAASSHAEALAQLFMSEEAGRGLGEFNRLIAEMATEVALFNKFGPDNHSGEPRWTRVQELGNNAASPGAELHRLLRRELATSSEP